jgi:hypothetical protein
MPTAKPAAVASISSNIGDIMQWLVGLMMVLGFGLCNGTDKTFTLLATYPHSTDDYTYD